MSSAKTWITLVFAASSLLLTACATPIPLNTIQYDSGIATTSAMSARLSIVPTSVGAWGSTARRPFGAISFGPIAHLQFHARDQLDFGEALSRELVRHRLFRSVTNSPYEPSDIDIKLFFEQTFHDANGQEYTLDVLMVLTGASKPFEKQYRVISSERDTTWERLNTSAYEGKAKAAKLLMEKLIRDMESYLMATRPMV